MHTTLRHVQAKAHLQTLKVSRCACSSPCIHEARHHVHILETHARETLGGVLRRSLHDAGIPEKAAATTLHISQSLLSRWILGGEGLRLPRLWALLGAKFQCCFLRELAKATAGVSVDSVIRVPEVA